MYEGYGRITGVLFSLALSDETLKMQGVGAA